MCPKGAPNPNDNSQIEILCPICLANMFRKRKSFVRPCLHIFCTKCITKWAKQIRSCPLCKQRIARISKKKSKKVKRKRRVRFASSSPTPTTSRSAENTCQRCETTTTNFLSRPSESLHGNQQQVSGTSFDNAASAQDTSPNSSTDNGNSQPRFHTHSIASSPNLVIHAFPFFTSRNGARAASSVSGLSVDLRDLARATVDAATAAGWRFSQNAPQTASFYCPTFNIGNCVAFPANWISIEQQSSPHGYNSDGQVRFPTIGNTSDATDPDLLTAPSDGMVPQQHRTIAAYPANEDEYTQNISSSTATQNQIIDSDPYVSQPAHTAGLADTHLSESQFDQTATNYEDTDTDSISSEIAHHNVTPGFTRFDPAPIPTITLDDNTDAASPEPQHVYTDAASPEPQHVYADAASPEPQHVYADAASPEPQHVYADAASPEPQHVYTDAASPEPQHEYTDAASPEPKHVYTDAASPEPKHVYTDAASPEPQHVYTDAASPELQHVYTDSAEDMTQFATGETRATTHNEFTDTFESQYVHTAAAPAANQFATDPIQTITLDEMADTKPPVSQVLHTDAVPAVTQFASSPFQATIQGEDTDTPPSVSQVLHTATTAQTKRSAFTRVPQRLRFAPPDAQQVRTSSNLPANENFQAFSDLTETQHVTAASTATVLENPNSSTTRKRRQNTATKSDAKKSKSNLMREAKKRRRVVMASAVEISVPSTSSASEQCVDNDNNEIIEIERPPPPMNRRLPNGIPYYAAVINEARYGYIVRPSVKVFSDCQCSSTQESSQQKPLKSILRKPKPPGYFNSKINKDAS